MSDDLQLDEIYFSEHDQDVIQDVDDAYIDENYFPEPRQKNVRFAASNLAQPAPWTKPKEGIEPINRDTKGIFDPQASIESVPARDPRRNARIRGPQNNPANLIETIGQKKKKSHRNMRDKWDRVSKNTGITDDIMSEKDKTNTITNASRDPLESLKSLKSSRFRFPRLSSSRRSRPEDRIMTAKLARPEPDTDSETEPDKVMPGGRRTKKSKKYKKSRKSKKTKKSKKSRKSKKSKKSKKSTR